MRIISVAVLGLALLAGCQGGDRLAKAANVPASNGSVEAAMTTQQTNPVLACLDKCRAKADKKNAKCMLDNSGGDCSAKLGAAFQECNEKCTPD